MVALGCRSGPTAPRSRRVGFSRSPSTAATGSGLVSLLRGRLGAPCCPVGAIVLLARRHQPVLGDVECLTVPLPDPKRLPTTWSIRGRDLMRSPRTIPIQPWKPIAAELSFPVLESKLAPAPGRPGLVPRGNLLDQLEASAAKPVVAVCAPAGYGKTVLAAAWAKRDSRPFVWLSIDRPDTAPAVLLSSLAVALDRVEPIDPAVFAALASRGASITQTVVPRLGAALSS